MVPERKLIVGRAGAGKTRLVLKLFQEHLQTRGHEKALFILPTASQAEHIKDLLLHQGRVQGIIDTEITNFAALARHYYLARYPGRPLGEAEKYLLLRRLLAEQGLTDFSRLRDYPGFLASLKSLIKEIKENLLTSQGLEGLLDRTDKRQPYAGLVGFYRRYQELLNIKGLCDEEDMLMALADGLGGDNPFPGLELLVVDGFNDYTRVEWQILSGLIDRAAKVFVTLTWEEGERNRELFAASTASRRKLLALGFEEVRLNEPHEAASRTLRELEANLFKGKRGIVAWDGSVRVLEAADIFDEVEEIAREVKSLVRDQGYQYRDIGIICRDLSEYADLIWGIFVFQGIPLRRYFRRALSSSGLVRAILDLASLFTAGLDVEKLQKVVKSEYFVFPRELADELEKYLLKRRPVLSWDSLASFSERFLGLKPFFDRLNNCRRKIIQAGSPFDFAGWCQQELAASLDFKLKSVPENPDQEARRREEGAAFAAFLNLLSQVSSHSAIWGTNKLTLTDFLELLKPAAALTTYSVRDHREDVVNLMDALEARQWELPVVFVCGLTEGVFPARLKENLFFNDEERRALNRLGKASFKEAEALHKEEVYLFYSAVTRAREKLFLTYPASDTKGEKNLPSFYLLELEELFSDQDRPARFNQRQLSRLVREPEEALDREELAKGLYQSISQTAGAHLAPLSFWLYNRCLDDFPYPEDLNRLYQGLKWELDAKKRATPRPYNSTQLAEFAQCPFRHFAGYGLRLTEFHDRVETGLDSKSAGRIVHDTLKRYFEKEKRPCLSDLFEELFNRAAWGLPLSLSELSAKEQMRDDLDCFIRKEEEYLKGSRYRPLGFEKPFGLMDAPPLYIEREAGEPITFSGRIDRLDVEEGAGAAAMVIDYKYGRAIAGAKEIEKVDEDARLQMALYLLAVRKVFNLEPVGAILCGIREREKLGIFNSAWWKGGPGSKEGRERFHLLEPDDFCSVLKWGEELAQQYVAGIESGEIEVRPRDFNRCGPGGCPFAAVCRFEKWWEQE